MSAPWTHRVAYIVATAALIAGCGERVGVLSVGDGVAAGTASRVTKIDFGGVPMGTIAQRSLVVTNVGGRPLTLAALESVAGDPVHVGETAGTNNLWGVGFQPGTVIKPGERAEFPVAFQPPLTASVFDKYRAVLVLTAEDVGAEGATASITLLGTGLSAGCGLPAELDFGEVAVEDSHRLAIELTNPTDAATTAMLGVIQSSSGDHTAFAYAPLSPQGDFELAPGAIVKAELEFRPTEKRDYVALVRVRPLAQCPEQVVQLKGSGVDAVLYWSPSQIDCGFTPIGGETRRQVTFTNIASAQVTLSGIRTLNNSEFGVVGGLGVDPTQLVVPAQGAATLEVWCKPLALGPRQTQLTFSTNLPRQPVGGLLLKAYGGGPDIEVTPYPTLNFGKVAYFANAQPPVFVRKKLTVANVGTTVSPPRNDGNLRLGQTDGSGHVIPDTYFTVTPQNQNTSVSEFTVQMPQGYDPQKGIEAVSGSNAVQILVTFTPTSVGLKEAEITLFSNDPDEPRVRVTVTADATILPPCNFSITPTTLSFGLISPPDRRDLGFTVKNNGTSPGDVCLLHSLDTEPGSHSFFTLPDGPVDVMELGPSDSKHVLVRLRATGPTPTAFSTITGSVALYMSSPQRPEVIVPLTAQLGPSCLMIAPDELDFGTVQTGCSSATTTFAIFNTCSSPVTLNSFRILGAPFTDPHCLATADCEFLLATSPAIPTGGLPVLAGAAPVTFQVRYRPAEDGLDSGAVAINATQNGTNVTYELALKGSADALGLHAVTYVESAKPKADVLLVVDNSGAVMMDYQQTLGLNFANFMKYAHTAQVDYRIAAIHTDSAASDYKKFVSGTGHPEKVLGPLVVDIENKFKSKVQVGTSGGRANGAEAALGALSAPLVNSDNAGFLRDEASLGILVVTDENDHSPLSATYYLSGFWNLKGFDKKSSFTFNAIASFDLTCPTVQDTGEYAFYVAQTNGVKASVCAIGWPSAENVGKTLFGFRTRFYLTSAPDLTKGAVDVKIDGVSIPATDSKGVPIWSFDAPTNSVDFEPMYVPEPGQTLTITYPTTCYP